MRDRYRIYKGCEFACKFRCAITGGFIVLFVLLIYICSEASGHNDLNQILRESIRDLKIPGAVMMVETPQGQVLAFRAGVRRIGSRKPMGNNLKFRIGSITKTFVASVILMLVNEGKISLDSEVSDLLPDIVPVGSPLTIRHLLQMRSCLGNFTIDKDFLQLFRERPWTHWSPEHLLQFGHKDYCREGKEFEYNNSNYVLLGLIIEKVSGDSFENQVYRRILSPLNLKSTTFPARSANISEPFARGHDYNPQTGKIKDLSLKINPSWAWCSGNGVSTASDVLIWLKAYLNGFGISSGLQAQQMDFRPVTYDGISYGLGIMNKYTAVGHNGNFAGIYTSLAFKFRGYYFVILTNGQAEGGGRKATAESVFWRVVERSKLFN
ncbi:MULTISPECIES: serine hydrolase domain-containing protein [unclassified Maridesulfovibrio]|uniref:serine hydrolase domain-containing protein n=1 Tax=unclassified Maridesulfovibrio TaxID=2794999 RepID=UPI003B3E76E0